MVFGLTIFILFYFSAWPNQSAIQRPKSDQGAVVYAETPPICVADLKQILRVGQKTKTVRFRRQVLFHIGSGWFELFFSKLIHSSFAFHILSGCTCQLSKI